MGYALTIKSFEIYQAMATDTDSGLNSGHGQLKHIDIEYSICIVLSRKADCVCQLAQLI